jgi:hypothetical protein
MTEDAGSLMRTLDHAVRQGNPAQLLIGGTGSVSVYPRQHCYVTDIIDWDAVYMAGAEQIRLGPALWAAPPAGALPLEELQWRAAMHSAQADVARSQQPVPRALVQLVSWPNITRLPDELAAPVTRICALLWRKPTVGYLVVRMLDLTPERAGVLLRALRAFGHVQWTESTGDGSSDERPSGIPESQLEVAAPASGRAAGDLRLISRLWLRLTGA